MGDRFKDLYKMNFKPYKPHTRDVNPMQAQANIGDNESLRIWHERLAHQNIPHVRQILKNWNIKTEPVRNWYCDGCAQGKMSRKSFPTSRSQLKEPGDLIHADLCGPMEHQSIGKSRYFLLLKDDFSHYKFVYFLNQKSQTTKCFEDFLKSTETQLERKIKTLRTDNGLEFTNKEMQEIMWKYGIKHETSTAYTPEQNGAIERENRTIVEAARSMLHAKNITLELWAEAVHTSIYVINRTGTSSKRGITPYELWFGEESKTLDYRVFGTEVYVHCPKPKRTKWSAKAKKAIFVGYDKNTKGYRIWLPSEGQVKVYRDVKFLLENLPAGKEEKTQRELAEIRLQE